MNWQSAFSSKYGQSCNLQNSREREREIEKEREREGKSQSQSQNLNSPSISVLKLSSENECVRQMFRIHVSLGICDVSSNWKLTEVNLSLIRLQKTYDFTWLYYYFSFFRCFVSPLVYFVSLLFVSLLSVSFSSNRLHRMRCDFSIFEHLILIPTRCKHGSLNTYRFSVSSKRKLKPLKNRY